jgi:MFS family permease
MGYFLPTIYLPSYARSLGASNIESSLTVMLFNLASVFGCVIMGSLVDRYHATTCILGSTVGSTIAVFLIWGFADTLAPLYIFCIFYGLFAGSFTSTWPAVVNEVKKNSAYTESSIVFGFLSTGRGIGNIVSGPLSEALLKRSAKAYGSGFGPLIVFTGVSALLGGVGIAARSSKLLRSE